MDVHTDKTTGLVSNTYAATDATPPEVKAPATAPDASAQTGTGDAGKTAGKTAGTTAPRTRARSTSGPKTTAQADGAKTAGSASGGTPPAPPVNATDEAVALATEHSVDLATVTGTGVDGRVLVGDVQAAVDAADGAGA